MESANCREDPDLCELIVSFVLDYGIRRSSGRSLRALLDVAPERLVPFLTRHKLLPIVMRAAGDDVPAALAVSAAASLRKHECHSRALLAEAQAMAEALSERHVRCALLKGHGLSMMAYGDLHARPAADIDLIVHPNDLSAVHDLAMARGYTQDLLYAGEASVSRERPRRPVAKLTDRLLGNYHRIADGVDYCVEIHYRVDGVGSEATDALLDHATEQREQLGALKVPADELQFLFFCIDKRKDLSGGLPVSPRDILDLLMIIGRKRQAEFWSRVTAWQDELGASHAVASVLGLLKRLAGNSADPAHPVWRLAAGQDEDVFARVGWPLIFETRAGVFWTTHQRAETQRASANAAISGETSSTRLSADPCVDAWFAQSTVEDAVVLSLHIGASEQVLCARGSIMVRLFEYSFSAPPPGRGCEVVWCAEHLVMRTFGLDLHSALDSPPSITCQLDRTSEGGLDIRISVPLRLLDAIASPGEGWATDLVLCAPAYSRPDDPGRFTKRQVAVLPRRPLPSVLEAAPQAVGDRVAK
jgi:hypothetical protein